MKKIDELLSLVKSEDVEGFKKTTRETFSDSIITDKDALNIADAMFAKTAMDKITDIVVDNKDSFDNNIKHVLSSVLNAIMTYALIHRQITITLKDEYDGKDKSK